MIQATPTSYISLRALVHNFRICHARAGGEIIAVVKADAYGHGAFVTTRVLLSLGARLFAVANAKEALALAPFFKRNQDCKEHFTYSSASPTLLVLGPIDKDSLFPLLQLKTVLSVHSHTYAKRLNAALGDLKARGLLSPHFRQSIALKAETGMHRLGLSSVAEAIAVCRLPHLFPHTLYSHFGEGGSISGRTYLQAQAFGAFAQSLSLAGYPLFTHLSASAALLRLGRCGADAARAGIALYGVGGEEANAPLLPVMRLCARVLGVTHVPRGAGVGYGTYRSPRKTRIAVLGIGYADGLPPSASGVSVLIRGQPCPIVGEVCMDRTLVDIGSLPLREGEEIAIFGTEAMPASRFAALCGISPYVLLSVRSARTERVFVSS